MPKARVPGGQRRMLVRFVAGVALVGFGAIRAISGHAQGFAVIALVAGALLLAVTVGSYRSATRARR